MRVHLAALFPTKCTQSWGDPGWRRGDGSRALGRRWAGPRAVFCSAGGAMKGCCRPGMKLGGPFKDALNNAPKCVVSSARPPRSTGRTHPSYTATFRAPWPTPKRPKTGDLVNHGLRADHLLAFPARTDGRVPAADLPARARVRPAPVRARRPVEGVRSFGRPASRVVCGPNQRRSRKVWGSYHAERGSLLSGGFGGSGVLGPAGGSTKRLGVRESAAWIDSSLSISHTRRLPSRVRA
jgi:hypothetical protein